ncbi:outer membrane beta-barrel protein [Fontimonas sp. SYSU GA230001]|uniref:outer membrane beta-barrel protein n=1 Tax=Fontimonas sp. SYSU GA230001 TaxID=3142450 RepID=UPI0032B4FB99
MKFTSKRCVVACCLGAAALCASLGVRAQGLSGYAGDPESGSRLRTSLEVGTDYTTNFFYARKAAEDSGSGLIVRPELSLTRKLSRFTFSAAANAEAGWYDLPGNADDYFDSALKLGSRWQSAPRHQFDFEARLRNGHNPFGTERTENTPLEDRKIDTWRETQTELRYLAGLPSDRLNFELGLGGLNKEYTNNEAVTRFLSHEKTSAYLTTYLNMTTKSSVFLVVAGQRTYFEDVAPGAFDRGATTLRYLLGARWAATAKTSGDFRVGYVDRNPTDPNRDSFQRFDWLAELTWAPRAVRKLLLQTGRTAQESFLNTVDFIDNRYGTLTWSEQWTPLMQTQATVRYMTSSFIGSSRQDESWGYGLSAEYQLTPYLALLGLASHGQRDSEVNFANYERFYAYLGARYAR